MKSKELDCSGMIATEEVLCSKLSDMRSVGDIALNPSFCKSDKGFKSVLKQPWDTVMC